MRFTLLCIGKTGQDFLEKGEKMYLDRLKHYIKTEKIELPDIKNARKLSEEEVKQKEGEQFLKLIQPGDRVILLDEKGKSLTSMQFSQYLQKTMNTGAKHVYFLVGGPYGFADAIYQRADGKIRLSDMTFSHQMIRLFFLEQVYRGLTILKGEPYHHE